jgi:hypothetical protein
MPSGGFNFLGLGTLAFLVTLALPLSPPVHYTAMAAMTIS